MCVSEQIQVSDCLLFESMRDYQEAYQQISNGHKFTDIGAFPRRKIAYISINCGNAQVHNQRGDEQETIP